MAHVDNLDDVSWLERGKVLDGMGAGIKPACVEDMVKAWRKATNNGYADVYVNDLYIVTEPPSATRVGIARFRTDEMLTPEQVLGRMRERGFQPASFEDLITYFEEDPLADKAYVIALGTRVTKIIKDDMIGYPAIQRSGSSRILCVKWLARDTACPFGTVFLFRHPGKS